jgi:hypothetical protein
VRAGRREKRRANGQIPHLFFSFAPVYSHFVAIGAVKLFGLDMRRGCLVTETANFGIGYESIPFRRNQRSRGVVADGDELPEM